MKLKKRIAVIGRGAVFALMLAGCSTNDASFLPGLPLLLTSGLPRTCKGPDSYKPDSPCAKDLTEAKNDVNYRIRDNNDVRLYLDSACADDAAWQPGSTCHLLTELLQQAGASFPVELRANAPGPSSAPGQFGQTIPPR